MSLQDYLDRKRVQTSLPETASLSSAASPAGELQAGVTSHPPPPDKPVESALLLRCRNREMWAFPWPCFTEAHFEPADAGDTHGLAARATFSADSLRLVFGRREVTLLGKNLAGLMESASWHLLCEVRETPREHAAPANAESGAPVVWEIRVCEREREQRAK